ncbi:MAG: TraM recognition domain-containing protein, partial [Parvularculaceae bacterium]|nr:TraM recognition domain-containing protein [Parvularculaceae bacterium]
EQKDGKPVTVFLVADASRIEAQAPVLGLLNWCMLTELKRHENKSVPTYLYAEECTNYKVDGLGSLLTWGRSYGLRLHLVVQSLSAFRRVYGQEALNTLLSETEIKQILPATREPETLSMVEKMLGETAIMTRGHRQSAKVIGEIEGHDLREDIRPLMTADELRRTEKTVLIVRKHKPMLVELPPYAAIAPWRKEEVGINPFHGKPFLLPVRLRLKRRKVRRYA